jgi:hypothetical protein
MCALRGNTIDIKAKQLDLDFSEYQVFKIPMYNLVDSQVENHTHNDLFFWLG